MSNARLVSMTEEQAERVRSLIGFAETPAEGRKLLASAGNDRSWAEDAETLRSLADTYKEGLDAADAIATLEAAYFDGLPDALYDTEGIIQRLRSLLDTEETSDA